MNKVVTKIMSVEELPEALRGDFAPDHSVEIVIRDLGTTSALKTKGHFSRHFPSRRSNYDSLDDIVSHIRQVRDGDD